MSMQSTTGVRQSKSALVPHVFIVLAMSFFPGACTETMDALPSNPDVTAVHGKPADYISDDLCGQTSGCCNADPLKVKTRTGWIQGKRVGVTAEFLGIPYATPPVGELRFAPPEPAADWDGVLDATEFGPACTQLPSPILPESGQEDCLTLNVFKPAGATKGDRLPVMVFIHGGAFVSGSGSDMQGISEAGNVIGVSMNYRLGALGFLSHPEIDAARCPNAPSGNDGLRDQQLALKWVKKNIRAFGGDPSNVTVFGESAGSMSTCIQMVSPSARHLADRFIMESAVCAGILPGGLPVYTKDEVDVIGTALVDDLCAGESDIMTCLRTLPAETLIAWGADFGMFGAGWGPSYNPADHFLPESPAELIAQGNYNPGEVIVGTNLNEWGLFMMAPITSVGEFNAAVDREFGSLANALKAHYVVNSDAEANDVFIQLMTDRTFRCPTRTFVRAIADQGTSAYLYHFEELPAFHAFELPYIFGPQPGFPPNVVSLQTTMQSYWSTFAIAGDPNVDGQPEWPMYSQADDIHMILKATSEVGSALGETNCDFWDALVAE